jgi:putative hydrolase of the HAD superfamily
VIGFGHIDTWVFDLDNTLYPASCRLFDQMHVKMGNYVMRHFNVEYDEAKRMQKDLYLRHGTTLRGLMVEHDHMPVGFLEEVHDIDYSAVPNSPSLRTALENLPGRKLIYTNGTTGHANRVIEKLGIDGLFSGFYDIVDSDYIPKPQREPYEKFLREHNVVPSRSAFFEDLAVNLKVPHEMGMVTVLVASDDADDAKLPIDDITAPHIHHTTYDLAGFLAGLKLGD